MRNMNEFHPDDPRIGEDRKFDFRRNRPPFRGFYGGERGYGYSPYTSEWPVILGVMRHGESPYTIFTPTVTPIQRPYGFGESPYTRMVPNYRNRYSSGESPYTDFGPYRQP